MGKKVENLGASPFNQEILWIDTTFSKIYPLIPLSAKSISLDSLFNPVFVYPRNEIIT
jgi:hypothetical protein